MMTMANFYGVFTGYIGYSFRWFQPLNPNKEILRR